MAKSVPERLADASVLYAQRNAVYGDNFRKFGLVMTALFPEGVTIDNVDAWNRLGILIQVVAKLSRYTANFGAGGHADSLADTSVYAAILGLLDDEQRELLAGLGPREPAAPEADPFHGQPRFCYTKEDYSSVPTVEVPEDGFVIG